MKDAACLCKLALCITTVRFLMLGIMLNKVCIKEGVALVNIVRKQEQVYLLTELGAKFVVNSSSESFKKDLFKAIDATGAPGFNTYCSEDNK